MELTINHGAFITGDGVTEGRLRMMEQLPKEVLTGEPKYVNMVHKSMYLMGNAYLIGAPDAPLYLEYNGYMNDGGHIKTRSRFDADKYAVTPGNELACYNYNGALYDTILRTEFYGNGAPLSDLQGKLCDAHEKVTWLSGQSDWRAGIVAAASLTFGKQWCRETLNLSAAEANAWDVYAKHEHYRQFSNENDDAAVSVTQEQKNEDKSGYFSSNISDLTRGFLFLRPIEGALREINELFYEFIFAQDQVKPVYLYASMMVVEQPVGFDLSATPLTLEFLGAKLTAPMFSKLEM